MKLLVDANLSFRVAELLRGAGIDAIHVRERDIGEADDEVILELALEEGRVIVSEDGDFSALLARHRLRAPSFVLFRSAEALVPEQQSRILLDNLPALATDLAEGCVAVFRRNVIRVRRLPL